MAPRKDEWLQTVQGKKHLNKFSGAEDLPREYAITAGNPQLSTRPKRIAPSAFRNLLTKEIEMFAQEFIDMAIAASGMYDKNQFGYPAYDPDGAVEMLKFICCLNMP